MKCEIRRPVQANQHNRPDVVEQRPVLNPKMLEGAKHVSRPGTRSKAEKKWPGRSLRSRWILTDLG